MANKPGTFEGRHYTEWVDQITALERAGRAAEAERLLLGTIAAVEEESRSAGYGVAPWYYERLAILYAKANRTTDELRILERFAAQKHALGQKPLKLLARLAKLRQQL